MKDRDAVVESCDDARRAAAENDPWRAVDSLRVALAHAERWVNERMRSEARGPAFERRGNGG